MSVAVSETRAAAATLAGNAYRTLHNESGRAPSQVRVISAADLAAEGGDAASEQADTDIGDRPDDGS